jgi:hypothetical protein
MERLYRNLAKKIWNNSTAEKYGFPLVVRR